jgi:hypothetical protein
MDDFYYDLMLFYHKKYIKYSNLIKEYNDNQCDTLELLQTYIAHKEAYYNLYDFFDNKLIALRKKEMLPIIEAKQKEMSELYHKMEADSKTIKIQEGSYEEYPLNEEEEILLRDEMEVDRLLWYDLECFLEDEGIEWYIYSCFNKSEIGFRKK